MKKFKNLSNTTWQIFDNPGVMGAGINVFRVTFDSNGDRYTEIKFVDEGNQGKLYYEDTYVATYPDGDWEDEKFQEIAIDGGEDVANPMLINWLNKYARCETTGAQTQDVVKAINSLADAVRGGGGGGGGDIVTVSLVINMEDPTLSYLDTTAKELYELFQAEKIIYAKSSFTYSEEGYSETVVCSSPISSARKEVQDDPDGYIAYEFVTVVETHFMVFKANSDDEKPIMWNG